MKVSELIEELSKLNPELEVRVWDDTPIEYVEEVGIPYPGYKNTRGKYPYVLVKISHWCEG